MNGEKSYKIICPYCGREQYACKSLFQEMGTCSIGYGTCLYCRRSMKLNFDYGQDIMTAGTGDDNQDCVPAEI